MKKRLPYFIVIAQLLILLQPGLLRAQEQYHDSLQHAMQTAASESDRLHAAVLLARDLVPTQKDSARALLEGAAALEHSEELTHRAEYYNVWGLYYWDLRDRPASTEYYKQTLQLQPDPSIMPQRAEAANHVGLLYYQLGVVDSARVYLYKAFEIDQERGNNQGLAKIMYDLSRLHRSQNQYELAFTYITEAIKLQEEFGEPRLLPFLYNVLGITHAALEERDLAAAAYEQSLQYAIDQELDKEVTIFYNNMAALWCEQEGMPEKSLHYAEKGLEMARSLGYTDLVASLLTNKGQALLTAGQPAEALELFNEAMEYNRQLNRPRVEMDVNYRIGRANKALGNFDVARQAQRRALEIAKELQSPSYQSDALLELAAMDSLENRHEDFRRHYVQGIKLRDSIWSQENRSHIAELQIIHATEQKEREIEQLKQQEQVRQLRMTIVVSASVFVFVLLLLAILYLGIRQKLVRQKYAMQQQQAEAKLEANLRELTGKALSLARSDQLIARLKKDIQEVADLLKRSTRTIENTRNSIRKKMGLQSGDNLVQLLLQV